MSFRHITEVQDAIGREFDREEARAATMAKQLRRNLRTLNVGVKAARDSGEAEARSIAMMHRRRVSASRVPAPPGSGGKSGTSAGLVTPGDHMAMFSPVRTRRSTRRRPQSAGGAAQRRGSGTARPARDARGGAYVSPSSASTRARAWLRARGKLPGPPGATAPRGNPATSEDGTWATPPARTGHGDLPAPASRAELAGRLDLIRVGRPRHRKGPPRPRHPLAELEHKSSNSSAWQHTEQVVCDECGGMKIPPPRLPRGWQEFPADPTGLYPHAAYFYREADGTVLWEPPPGSDKSSIIAFAISGSCQRSCECHKKHKKLVARWQRAAKSVAHR